MSDLLLDQAIVVIVAGRPGYELDVEALPAECRKRLLDESGFRADMVYMARRGAFADRRL